MTAPPQLRVLFFDVFGTTVKQRTPVADELARAAKEALESQGSSISSEVRKIATEMTYDQWFELGGQWNKDEDEYVSALKAKTNNVDWKAVDAHRLVSLHKLLTRRGLIIPGKEVDDGLSVEAGSLWSLSQLRQLTLIWRHLTPWPDTHQGLTLLNQKFATVTLSNTYNDLLQELISHSSLPFTQTYSADMFESYKPNPKVYLGAAEKMGAKPGECALVAAHLGDLQGAKKCGFYPIYVERALEEKAPELKGQGIPEMVVREDEEGFVALARRLGVRID